MTSNFKTNEFIANSTIVNTITFGPKSYRILATGGDDCKVNIWRFDKSNENITSVWSLTSNKAPIKALCFDNEEKCVVSGSMNGSIKVFDMSEGKLARNIGGHQTNITALQYHPYGEFIASGSTDCSTKLWDVRNKTCILTYSGHDKEVTCLRFSPDGRLLAASSKDGNLIIYDLVAGKLQNTIKMGSTTHVTTFEFNPSEFLLATVTNIRMIRFYDLESMEMICNTPPESSPVKSIFFSNDGDMLYTCSKDTFRSFSWDTNSNYSNNNNSSSSSSSYIKMENSIDVPWTKIHEIKVSPTNHLLGASFQNNFATIWSLDLNLPYEAQLPQQSSSSSSSLGQPMNSPLPKSGGGGGKTNSSSNNNNSNSSVKQVQQPASSYVDSYSHSKSPRLPASSSSSSSSSSSASPKLVSKSIDNSSSSSSGNGNHSNDRRGGASHIHQSISASSQSSQWASEASSRDLASSMSDTLWRKFREEHSDVTSIVGSNSSSSSSSSSSGGSKPVKDEYKLKSLNDDDDNDDDDEDHNNAYDDDNFDNDSVNAVSNSNNSNNNDVKTKRSHLVSASPLPASTAPVIVVSKSVSVPAAAVSTVSPIATVNSNGRHTSSSSSSNSRNHLSVNDPTEAVLNKAMNALRMRENAANNSPTTVNHTNSSGSSHATSSGNSNNNNSISGKRRSSNSANINNRIVGNSDNDSNIRPPWTDVLPVTNNSAITNSSGGNGLVGSSVRQSFDDPLRMMSNLQRQQQSQQLLLQQQRPQSSSSSIRRDSFNRNHMSDDIYTSPSSQPLHNHPSSSYLHMQQPNADNVFSSDSVRHIRNNRDGHLYSLNESIDQFMSTSTPLTAQLSTRTTALRMLRKLWQKSDMTDVLDYCHVLHESSRLDGSIMIVLIDFFHSINLKSIGLTLSHCIQLIQIFDTMLSNNNTTTSTTTNNNTSFGGYHNNNMSANSSIEISEQGVLTAISSLVLLLQSFADLIHDTRHTMNNHHGMIDISKEERLEKCNLCVNILIKLKTTRLEQIKKMYKKSNKMFALLVQLQPLIDLAIS